MNDKSSFYIPICVVALLAVVAVGSNRPNEPIKRAPVRQYAVPVTNTTESLLKRLFGPSFSRGQKKKKRVRMR